MTQEQNPRRSPKKIKPEQWIFIIFAVVMVAAIGGMMFIEHLGEVKMGDSTHVRDAADR